MQVCAVCLSTAIFHAPYGQIQRHPLDVTYLEHWIHHFLSQQSYVLNIPSPQHSVRRLECEWRQLKTGEATDRYTGGRGTD